MKLDADSSSETDHPRPPIPVRVCRILCLILGLAGIAAYLLSSGFYFGRLNGHFVLTAPDGHPRYVEVVAESTPVWMWRKPNNFAYDCVTIIEAYGHGLWPFGRAPFSIAVFFPSLQCKCFPEKQTVFSAELVQEFFLADAEPSASLQSEELYQFILSAGNGTAPPVRPEPYQFDGPFEGSLTHCAIATGMSQRSTGILLMAAAVGSWLAAYGYTKLVPLLEE